MENVGMNGIALDRKGHLALSLTYGEVEPDYYTCRRLKGCRLGCLKNDCHAVDEGF